MEYNILCQKDDQIALTDFFEGVSNLLKDCDDCGEKEKIKKVLHSMNDTVTYVFLGEETVGKTTLLRNLFQNIVKINEEMDADICEYRYGEQEFMIQPSNGFQKIFLPSENLRGISIIDTKGINRIADVSRKKLGELIAKCEVVFVVLDILRINSPGLWDVIEEFNMKKMIFFVTKCDLVSQEEMIKSIEKIKCYQKEAGISATVFPVSMEENAVVKGTKSIEEVCLYIRNEVVGVNPLLKRQWSNIEETKELLKEFGKSLELRQKQYLSDAAILQKINQGLDKYIINQEKIVAELVDKVTEDINREIDAYENEIISKMDPYKIKERFRNQQDFTDYLNMVNDNYKNIMNDSVNRKTISVIKKCLHELEMVFEDAVGFFNERKSILALNDKFYGSLSVSRKNMVSETKQNIYTINSYYKSLYEASETLFLQIWQERKKYDNRILLEQTLSGLGGATAGTVGGAALGSAIFTAKTMVGLCGTAGLIVIGAIIGAVLIKKIVGNLYEPGNANRMEETVQKCIEQFKEEVNRARIQMTGQISMQMKEIFASELTTVDGYFTEFRMSVNIDEQKLPLMEAKLQEIHNLLNAIEAKQ